MKLQHITTTTKSDVSLVKAQEEPINGYIIIEPQSGLNTNPTFPESQMELDGQDITVNTTNFHNDAGMREATIQDPQALNPLMYKDPENFEATSLAFYLSRPVRLQQGVIGASDPATKFTAMAMPQTLLTEPIYADKPRGRYGFRATMVFRLVVNAERFHQGRYMLTYCPLGGARYGTNQKGNAWVNKHSATLVQRSQLPHVEFDLNCDSEVTLRIPYASVHDFYRFSWANSLSTGEGTWGVLRLFPYSSLDYSGGSSECDYTIYGHFEDIEFVGFSSVQITAQSNDPFSSSVKKKSVTSKEAKSNGVGPITSIATQVATASRYLVPIPMLSAFAGSTAWAADIVASVASVFGWSSPLNVEKASRMAITNYAYYSNVNKVDNSFPLALTTDNEVAIAAGFSSTGKDELDFTSVATIPAFLKAVQWTTGQTVGQEITNITLYPDGFQSSNTYNGQTCVSMLPIAYVAKNFGLWRGSIIIKIKIVKTEFHSGRLAFAYFPSGDYSSRTLDNTDYLHRDIIDIREHSEVTLTIPYTSPTTYKEVSNGASADNGVFSVFVVDRLVAPSTVAAQIRLIFEIAGGPDIEFAAPKRTLAYTATQDFTVQSNDPFAVNSDCNIIDKPIGAAANPTFQLDTSQLCIGERIMSFRQLVKKYYPIVKFNYSSDTTLNILAYGAVCLDSTAGTDSFTNCGDLYSELSAIYMFSRGGVRFKIFPNLTTTPDRAVTFLGDAYYVSSSSIIGTSSSSPITNANTAPDILMNRAQYVTSDIQNNRAIEVAVPQYHFNKSRNNSEQVVAVGSPYSSSYAASVVISSMLLSNNSNTAVKVPFVSPYVLRAGADDCNFGLFVSIPPFVINPLA